MKIDDRVEQLVRDTLHWAVKRKPDEFGDALRAFPNEATRRSALELLVAICGYTAVDVFGQRPSEDQIRALAADIAEDEGWASVTTAEVAAYIDAVLGGSRKLDALPSERLVPVSFVVAANLLSSKPKAPGEWWFNYLDKVEAAIEAAR
ncbi:hypothetical protein GA0074692_0464 [Micromonospora pallida]|uniref:Uncharacterized protein n=1 Tax=Micromonospora pallida TaxID=145854 RepID=A0A1C6RNV8_9ACTN|nr:hypothetical protein [Micromonospora pallida]SCL18739.1 hypothetical protein GA0074692_0464 [Micromonospora pallida]